jgi:hypothetical protein
MWLVVTSIYSNGDVRKSFVKRNRKELHPSFSVILVPFYEACYCSYCIMRIFADEQWPMHPWPRS